LALPIWQFEDDTFYVVGSKEELNELAVEGWDEFEGKSPHRPWIDKVKIRHPESGLIGTRIPDVGNPWLDAGIVPYSTLHYNSDQEYWNKWFPAEFVVECLPGQFRNWFYSLLALSTVMEGKAPFKTLLGHALVKDETGRDMHKSWGNAIWFDEAAEKMGVDVMRWMYASQNPEHNLLFGYGSADEVRKQLITLWNTYSFFVTYANLDGFDPSMPIDNNTLTISDRWIISKTNRFIITAEKYYNTFQVFQLMSEATQILDDLSNWYIRRNRRRFWKSENDSDKMAAYSTLYQVLIKFVKVMAPVIPFVTDKIYSNLMVGKNDLDVTSVHLCEYPTVHSSDIDENVINEIDVVIQIVSLSRSARNKANIKIRQPLAELAIYANDDIQKIAINNKNEILEELNIKSLNFVANESDLVQYNVKPDFPTLGQKYGKDISRITAYLNDVDNEKLVQSVKSGKPVFIKGDEGELEILADELILQEMPMKDYAISAGKHFIVGVNTLISEPLKQEGLVRDLIRQVQNLRKDSGLKVEDRIEIEINGSEELNNAVESYESYFMNEVLGVKLNMGNSNNFKFYGLVKIAGKKTNIGISPLNG